MRTGVVGACALLAGCGRLHFDPVSTGSGSDLGLARSTLALDRVDPGTTITDFPLLVVLDDTRAARDLLDAQATDLRFLDATGNVLAYELEQIGSAGGAPLVAWVRVPTIVGTTTTIEVAIGGTLPAASAEPVWSGDFAAVFHMTSGATDSTANHNDGTAVAPTAITAMTGMIAGAQSFDDTSLQPCYEIADAASLAVPVVTISGWMRQAATSPGIETLVARAVTGSVDDDFLLGTTVDQPYAEVFASSSGLLQLPDTAGTVTIGQWAHLAMTVNATTLALFQDGALVQMASIAGDVQHDPQLVLIGADANSSVVPNGSYLGGAVDEIRIETVARTPSWVMYDDLSQRDELISYGPIER
ncbi:MAG TPA: LamG-like jellyroll fold domain-containing protein [Kofleriaceae bacterium]|nr:LamG-like jellyroll fold domain-containing protein [Kofleriaceae bacterium]